MARDIALLLTHSADHFTIDRVAAALARRGARALRVNSDQFPRQIRLAFACDTAGATQVLQGAFGEIEAASVRAVWARKLWSPALGDELDPAFRASCERESQAALRGFLRGLEHARWIDPIERQALAEDKLWQLRAAQAVGLEIPRTLVSNDPERVRAFYRALEGRMVAKLLTPISTSMDASGAFVYTSEVREDDLADIDALCYSPMVFQARVEKRCELRVAYVAGRLFVGAIDASRSAEGGMDWRRAAPGECVWRHDRVPDELAERIRALMARLGLAYGALDLICTPEGSHVFLEVNPAGEWGMLERDLDLPIAEALADALMEESCPAP